MERRYLYLASSLIVAACQQQPAEVPNASASMDSAAANIVGPNTAAAVPQASGCADRLNFVMNPSPAQLSMQEHMPTETLERVRSGTEQRFKSVANRMCAGGDLPASLFGAYDRVMITDAEGATEPTLYAGENRTLNYELAFAGDQTVPADEMFRDAFLCLQDATREGCFED
jgi:hypothetical protein